ncbi:MAG: stage II sporulation protein M [Acidobacteriota bacterium]
MIIDIPRFLVEEQKYWSELNRQLDQIEREPTARLTLEQVRRFHYLYQRACADLVKIQTSAYEPAVCAYLESLVARAYSEIYESRGRVGGGRKRILGALGAFPRAFRRHFQAFVLSVALTLAGIVFAAGALYLDAEAKAVIMPFPQLRGSPNERVRQEESGGSDRLEGSRAGFSAFLMTHNIRVSVLSLSLGITGGIGTAILLFYNGAVLGAVSADYVRAGEGVFLLGWLLPHGVIEIPAALIAAQGGFVLAGAWLGGNRRKSLVGRLREVSRDLVILISGAAALLVWAGLVEAFFSQYHEPTLPYSVKIAFGCLELAALAFYLLVVGRKPPVPGELQT